MFDFKKQCKAYDDFFKKADQVFGPVDTSHQGYCQGLRKLDWIDPMDSVIYSETIAKELENE